MWYTTLKKQYKLLRSNFQQQTIKMSMILEEKYGPSTYKKIYNFSFPGVKNGFVCLELGYVSSLLPLPPPALAPSSHRGFKLS